MKGRRRITLTDVAREAGVSRSTVSLVLRGSTAPSQRTAGIVIDSIRKLGYVYNRTAANLRTRETHTVGLIIPNIENRFFSQLTVGAERTFDSCDKTVLLANTSECLTRQRKAITTMLEHNVDGILFCPAAGTKPEDLTALVHGSAPVVFLVRRIPGVPCHFVANDNTGGVAAAVTRLLEQGHKKISFVGGYPDTSAYHERVEGYRLAFMQNGQRMDPSMLHPGENSFEGGYQTASDIMNLSDRPTAAFCFNDMTALGFIKGAEQAGFAVGADIAVIGFDDIREAAMWQPPLSSVRSHPEQVGSVGADLLLRIIKTPGGQYEELRIPVSLVERESSRR